MQRVKTHTHFVTSALSLMVGRQSHDKDKERQTRLCSCPLQARSIMYQHLITLTDVCGNKHTQGWSAKVAQSALRRHIHDMAANGLVRRFVPWQSHNGCDLCIRGHTFKRARSKLSQFPYSFALELDVSFSTQLVVKSIDTLVPEPISTQVR